MCSISSASLHAAHLLTRGMARQSSDKQQLASHVTCADQSANMDLLSFCAPLLVWLHSGADCCPVPARPT